jgi:hypothetical protein
MSNVGAELYFGMRMGIRNGEVWFRQRFAEPGGPASPGDSNYTGQLRNTRPLVDDGMGHHVSLRLHTTTAYLTPRRK